MSHECRHPSHHRQGFALMPLLVLGAVLLAVIAFVIANNHKPNDGPKPVVWDKTPCAHCAMHLGDPRFAAQLTTEAGETYFYDDPGCLFEHRQGLLQQDVVIHAMWFRDRGQDRWLSSNDVAFLPTEGSPMDYGFGAVPMDTPGAIPLATAAQEVLEK